MGIVRNMAHLILREHAHKPITGEFLLCGRQSVFLTPDQAIEMIGAAGLLRKDIEPRIDRQTRGSAARDWILDESFFELFTDARLNAVDVSDYEGADIVHDMCRPVPEEHYGRFSFIFNGSCMDNLAGPLEFLRNTSRMLAPGGVVMHIEHGSRERGAYLMYSPDYFFDFYALNGYADCKVYAAVCEGHHKSSEWTVFQWYPTEEHPLPLLYTRAGVMVVTIAEKAAQSSDDRIPLQAHYRPTVEIEAYFEAARLFLTSPRPVLRGGEPTEPVPQSNYPAFCGVLPA